VQDFRKLKVWEKGHAMTLAVYGASAGFPKYEVFGLTSQMRRSASSIPMNIAEGCGRGSDADFSRFLQMAMGSASELDYQLLLARDLNYLANQSYTQFCPSVDEIKRMLTGLMQRLKR
jgi:four helix bundle protein